MIIPSQKHLFDIPDDVAYLNNAYMSPLMHSVVAAMEVGISSKVQPWTYASDQFFVLPEEARQLAGKIFNSSAENIAIVPSASYGIQTAANILPISSEQNILVLKDQFPSNIYPWQDRASKVGATVTQLQIPKDDDWTRVLLEAIDSQTAIVAIPQTHWASGATIDLARIREALDDVGGALVLDLTQSLGAQPFSASDIRPDFAVAATYKWMMGPYSMGFLYVDPKWHKADPLEHNWINREGSENFAGLTNYRDGFQPGARRFDMGEKSNPAQLRGASAAMRQILDWGIGNIAETLDKKTKHIENELSHTSITTIDQNRRAPHYLGLRFDGGVPENLAASLAAEKIFVSVRGPAMRITPHLYATDHDIDRLIQALKRL
jgi:selenocysteine lyase/cysteine desulfurase